MQMQIQIQIFPSGTLSRLSVVRSGAADGPSSGLEGRHPMMHTAAVSVLSARVCGGVVFSFVGIPEQGSVEFLVTPLLARPKAGIMSAFSVSLDNVSGSGAPRSYGPAQRAASRTYALRNKIRTLKVFGTGGCLLWGVGPPWCHLHNCSRLLSLLVLSSRPPPFVNKIYFCSLCWRSFIAAFVS